MKLTNLEHFILSSNPTLVGPLPKGLNHFMKISSIDIKHTRMHRDGNLLLPKTLSPSGQYQMLNPMDNYQCPILVNLNVSRSNMDISPEYFDFFNCRCQPGTFGIRNQCQTCPQFCFCETGLELKGCYPSPSVEDMKAIVACSNPSACVTQTFSRVVLEVSSRPEEISSCAEGYEGRVCSRCKTGFGAQGRTCLQCGSILVYISMIIGPLFIIFLMIYLYRSDSEGSGKLGIVIFHTQTLSVIATAMSNSAAVESSMNVPFSVSSIQVPSISCIFGTTDAFTPVAASFIRLPLLGLVGGLAFKLTDGHKRDKVVFVVLNLARYIYYPIALETFGIFGCTLFDEGYDSWFLNTWPWISCNPATDEYNRMLALGIPTFLVFVCGFPVLLWFIVHGNAHSNRQDMRNSERKSRRTRYGFLYLPYKREHRFWGIVTTMRLLCFGLVIRVVPYTYLAAIFILLLVLLQGSIWTQHMKAPFLSNVENTMEITSLYTVFFSYFLVLVAGILGNSSWIYGLVILVNACVMFALLWETGLRNLMISPKKRQTVPVTISSVSLPIVDQESFA
eukprot:TRINITY_DN817_c0_g1_i10.p1 TRINITY_DN817_c0_g1~~TRINITY_DN817_c0_g1_i10.p1  ORF type:complete len:562 (+),score=67.03 TRINITY_DN817_c0_g1_i10:4689-6374(+)